jgi:hypothetical protein
MLFFLFGWLSFMGIVFNSILFFWNVLLPLQKENRVKFHCYIGFTSLLSTICHLLLSYIQGYNYESMIKYGIVLYLIVIASGIVLLHFPDAGKIRYQARSFHPALVIGLVIILLYHLMSV